MNRLGLAFVVIVVLLVAVQSVFIVPEYGQAIVVEVGKIKGKAIQKPGLYFKVPFVSEVIHFDKRWLEWDGDRNQIPTRDKKYIWMDAYARWRNVVASHDLIDIVRSSSRSFERSEEEQDEARDGETQFTTKIGRDQLEQMVLKKSAQVMPAYGIELADVQFRRVNYVDSVQEKVFERMISERMRIAQRFRSEGQGKAAEIEGTVEKELRTIESEAFRKAEEIRGKADGEAAGIYAAAYNKDAELYGFVRTLDAYRAVIDDKTQLVLSTDSDLLKLLKGQPGAGRAR